MIALGTVFAFTRLATRSIKRRLSLAEDAPILIAWACLLAQCANYIVSAGATYRALAVLRGDGPPSGASFLSDEISLRKSVFTNTLLMWISLWAVKVSLLVQCRQLVDQREKRTRVWWAILACCVLSLGVCMLAHALVCSPVDSWFSPGMCPIHRERRYDQGIPANSTRPMPERAGRHASFAQPLSFLCP